MARHLSILREVKKLKKFYTYFYSNKTIDKMSFPKFFCVEHSTRYKIYMNSIYKSPATVNTEISVLWPQENISARTMTIKMRNDREKSTTYRKWNGQEYKMISWSFTGSSIDMTLNDRQISITCPVIDVSDKSLLPFNCCSIVPSRDTFVDEEDRSNYEKAEIYDRDPNSPEYITPIPQRVVFTYTAVAPAPSAPSAPEAPSLLPTRKGLPQHVANIVLADAISKNEICPISSEDITKENGSVTYCGHVFCKESIDEWLSIKNECPVCKQSCL